MQRIPAPRPGMAEADLPRVIVTALGAAVLGAPEALARLRDVAGRNAAADVIFTVFLIAAVTSLVLGTMLLARYLRVAAGAGANDGARSRAQRRGTALFARLTLGVALAVAVFSTACLLAVPSVTGAGELDGAATATSCSA